jgi:hypothetical protein
MPRNAQRAILGHTARNLTELYAAGGSPAAGCRLARCRAEDGMLVGEHLTMKPSAHRPTVHATTPREKERRLETLLRGHSHLVGRFQVCRRRDQHPGRAVSHVTRSAFAVGAANHDASRRTKRRDTTSYSTDVHSNLSSSRNVPLNLPRFAMQTNNGVNTSASAGNSRGRDEHRQGNTHAAAEARGAALLFLGSSAAALERGPRPR